jgi:hypothetical protein
MAGNESRNKTGNGTGNKHQNISLSLATLARVVGRLRTSLYQPFAALPSGSHSESPTGPLGLRPKSSIRPGRPLAKIILFPNAIRPSTPGRRVAAATDNLLVYTDAWYSRAVAKSMPHRPFPSTYA